MSWLDFACGLVSRGAKKLHAEYRAGLEGAPLPSKQPRRAGEPSPSVLPSWCEVLGVPRGASLGEITAAYRQSIAKNHPDKVAHLSEKLRQVAEEETRRINAAYEEALRIVRR
ncbi:MAG TPA: J domain-containing protein [Chthoniobacter sp.]|jgi:DnaJ-domain-containing protein 1